MIVPPLLQVTTRAVVQASHRPAAARSSWRLELLPRWQGCSGRVLSVWVGLATRRLATTPLLLADRALLLLADGRCVLWESAEACAEEGRPTRTAAGSGLATVNSLQGQGEASSKQTRDAGQSINTNPKHERRGGGEHARC